MPLPSIALPGTLLGPSSHYAPGPGTHIHDSQIYASIAGPVISMSRSALPQTTKTTSKSTTKVLPLLSVTRPSSSANANILGSAGSGSTVLPEVDSVVLARVTRLAQRFATVEIQVVGQTVCRESFQGIIRREDVRATEKDKVKIDESFRVGDLVRGVVISLGDQSNYYLSMARNELGVVMATSDKGNSMYPVSWKEFRDPVTGATEKRKVAKPF